MNNIMTSQQLNHTQLKTPFGFTFQFYHAECEIYDQDKNETIFHIDIITDGVIKPLVHRAKIYDLIELYFKQKNIRCLEIKDLYGIGYLNPKTDIPNYGTIMTRLDKEDYMFI